ncbi:MAG: D-amino-acid transaminase [Ahrensia sp.]
MSRIAYVNGAYVDHFDAGVHVEDRGYQFADGVYEVCEIKDGAIIDERRHLDRLDRSLRELRIAWPMDRAALSVVLAETARRNRVKNGIVYLQVTRGVARRDHVFPAAGTPASIVVTSRATDPAIAAQKAEHGIEAIAVDENRWDRVDIKSVGLLPNCLARQHAKEQGAAEAIFVDADGMVKEGAATNAWIVTKDDKLVTRPAEHGILKGITRAVTMQAAAALGLTVEERAFSVEEAKQAREMFITAATTLVMPVVRFDEASIANGKPGETATALRAAFHTHAERTPLYRNRTV